MNDLKRLKVPAEHRFALPYLVDNGKLYGWETDYERGCALVRWSDGDWSVIDANNEVLGTDEDKDFALRTAAYNLTNSRRDRDGITRAKVG